MIRIHERLIAEHHQLSIHLTDDLGKEHILVVPLYQTREVEGKLVQEATDPDAEIAKLLPMLEEQERIALEHARKRGHLKEDCGCGPASNTSAGESGKPGGNEGAESGETES